MADRYETLVANILQAFRDLECNMRVKLHFMYDHPDRFFEYQGIYQVTSKDPKTMEERYQGK